jgi:hypothetical protein
MVAVSRYIRFGNLGFVPDDSTWQLTSDNVSSGTIMPFGDIDVFIGLSTLTMMEVSAPAIILSPSMMNSATTSYFLAMSMPILSSLPSMEAWTKDPTMTQSQAGSPSPWGSTCRL